MKTPEYVMTNEEEVNTTRLLLRTINDALKEHLLVMHDDFGVLSVLTSIRIEMPRLEGKGMPGAGDVPIKITSNYISLEKAVERFKSKKTKILNQ